MQISKKGIAIFVIADTLIVGLIVLVILYGQGAFSGAGSKLTNYIAGQITGIVNAQLVPELSYDEVTYEAPYTLRMRAAALTSPEGTRVIEFDTLEVTLAEVPRLNRPVRIAELIVDGGTVSVLMDPETGEIEGLVPMVERTPTPEDQAEVSKPFRLSNVLQLESIRVSDLDVLVDLGRGNGPVRIEGLAMDLDVEPDTENGAGWYSFAFDSGREPGLELDLTGAMNIDTFDVRINEGLAEARVGPDTLDSLPSPIAGPLREADARGDLRVTFTGDIPLRDAIAGSRLDVRTTLTDFNIASGDGRLPIDTATLVTTISSGTATIGGFDASLVGGTINATGAVHFGEDGIPVSLDWTMAGLDIERFLQEQEDGPDLAGIVNASGKVSGGLGDAPGSLRGDGTLTVREGRLVAVPIISQLGKAARIANMGKDPARRHQADVAFSLEAEGIRLDSFEASTAVLAARGDGIIKYDNTLDIDANAGPLEKLQSMLGGVGDVLGRVTDQLVTYRITGPIAEPEVGVKPLGVGG